MVNKINYGKFGILEKFIPFLEKPWLSTSNFMGEEEKKYSKIYDIAYNWSDKILKKETFIGLYMTGQNGSGKSFLGCCLVKKFLDAGKIAVRVNMIDLQQKFYKEWEIPQIALQSAIIFIDEVGKEYKTKAEHSEIMFEYILKYRAERKYPTILASNMGLKQLTERYGETVESLLVGEYLPLNFPEIDLRKRLVKEEIKKIIK